MTERTPPLCYICGKSCKDSVEDLYYCICDVAICHSCINTVKKNDQTWICPNCKQANDLEKSKLFRAS